MATKKDDTPGPTQGAGGSTDPVQDFLKALLRRAGGDRMDIMQAEVATAEEEGISEVEVVLEEMATDVEPVEGAEGPKILILRKKG